jgi:hypothetical protein
MRKRPETPTAGKTQPRGDQGLLYSSSWAILSDDRLHKSIIGFGNVKFGGPDV